MNDTNNKLSTITNPTAKKKTHNPDFGFWRANYYNKHGVRMTINDIRAVYRVCMNKELDSFDELENVAVIDLDESTFIHGKVIDIIDSIRSTVPLYYCKRDTRASHPFARISLYIECQKNVHKKTYRTGLRCEKKLFNKAYTNSEQRLGDEMLQALTLLAMSRANGLPKTSMKLVAFSSPQDRNDTYHFCLYHKNAMETEKLNKKQVKNNHSFSANM